MKKGAILTLDTDLDELKALLDTLHIEVAREFVQRLRHPHKTSFLGPGKIDEVAAEIKEMNLNLVVVNGILRPAQHHFLEMKFQMECIDRPGVILRIFANHAHSPEAIAQVTLAKLRYEQPFLREWIHKAKKGDRPGFLAGGAYATDVYYEHARTHSRKIEKSLGQLRERRRTVRSKRREKGYLLVSLAGYTNVGKSALLNALSGSRVEVDKRMFSTLSTTTRRFLGPEKHLLLTDTVGFIRNLPPGLVDAFNSTLEEIFEADLILLVFDANEDEETLKEKLESSLGILLPEVDPGNLMFVGNKIDLLPEGKKEAVATLIGEHFKGRELVLVSAKTGEGLDCLLAKVSSFLNYSFTFRVIAPQTNEVYSLLSKLRSRAKIEQSSVGTMLHIQISCRPEDREKVEGWMRSVGGKITSVSTESSEEGYRECEVPQEDKGPLSST